PPPRCRSGRAISRVRPTNGGRALLGWGRVCTRERVGKELPGRRARSPEGIVALAGPAAAKKAARSGGPSASAAASRRSVSGYGRRLARSSRLIGRASCRERVESSGGAACWKKKGG